ncbi:MAG: hypothetical protein KGI04_04505 [Candidatus Micrarchaeota archaeon]|nr:hypothetical protein [Candidatus Micrarchaeota archaeon]
MSRRIATAAGIGALLFATLAMTVGATQNQYGSGFPISCNGHIHGAFANINGNFSWIAGYAVHGGVGHATGPSNSNAADYCNDLAGH